MIFKSIRLARNDRSGGDGPSLKMASNGPRQDIAAAFSFSLKEIATAALSDSAVDNRHRRAASLTICKKEACDGQKAPEKIFRRSRGSSSVSDLTLSYVVLR
jgi:hypothetical protein